MDILPYLIVLVISAITGMYLHEGGHWFVGWLGNSDPDMQFVWGIPNAVKHGNIETVDSAVIRASGFINFLWLPPGIIALVHFASDVSLFNLFAAFVPIFVILGSTESDGIAFRDPERYREMEIQDDFPRNPLFIPNRIFPRFLDRF